MHHSNINTSDTEVNRLLFEGLTKENEKGKIVAGLAQRWEISQDYKKITFYLRDNLKYSNGMPMTSEDFLRTISKWKNSKSFYEDKYLIIKAVNDKILEVEIKDKINMEKWGDVSKFYLKEFAKPVNAPKNKEIPDKDKYFVYNMDSKKILSTGPYILKEYGVHATFFHIGYTITQENADILKRQITEGHAIANHSLSHNFNLLYPGRVPNQSQIVSEVNQTMANFQAILGKDFKTRIFRYPGGHMSWHGLESTDQALAKEGVQWMDWNMLCGDAEPASVRPTTSESMMAYLDGSQKYFPESHVKVVLMHDTAGKELTVQTLPQIIEYFKDQGYTFGVLE